MKTTFRLLIVAFVTLLLISSISAKTVRIIDYGAEPDDGIDDSSAIMGALQNLKESGGGTLIFPEGKTDINTGFIFEMTFPGNIRFTGDKSSIVQLNGDETTVYFDISQVIQFEMDNLIFSGNPQVRFDAAKVFLFKGIKQIKINKCHFFGIGAFDSVLQFENSFVSIEDILFTGSATPESLIRVKNSKGFSISNAIFENEGELVGNWADKAKNLNLQNWLRVENPATGENAMGQGIIRVKDTFFDSGAYNAILIENQGAVQVSGITVKLTPFDKGAALKVQNVNFTEVTNSKIIPTRKAKWAFNLGRSSYLETNGLTLAEGAILGVMEAGCHWEVGYCVGCSVSRSSFKKK
jgi:hypothetical protein